MTRITELENLSLYKSDVGLRRELVTIARERAKDK